MTLADSLTIVGILIAAGAVGAVLLALKVKM